MALASNNSLSGPAAGDSNVEQFNDSDYLPGLELIEELGKGSGGTVFKAKHETNKQELVAVKTLSRRRWSFSEEDPGFDKADPSQERWQALNKEADLLRRFESDYIIRFIFHEPNVFPYVIMELMDSHVGLMIFEDKLTVRHAFECFRCMLGALTYLHTASDTKAYLTHGDIKPENILVKCDTGGIMSFKLADFGLAEERPSAVKYTGTYPFLPPSLFVQCDLGEDVDDGPANDVFVLCLVMVWVFDDLDFRNKPPRVRSLHSELVKRLYYALEDDPSKYLDDYKDMAHREHMVRPSASILWTRLENNFPGKLTDEDLDAKLVPFKTKGDFDHDEAPNVINSDDWVPSDPSPDPSDDEVPGEGNPGNYSDADRNAENADQVMGDDAEPGEDDAIEHSRPSKRRRLGESDSDDEHEHENADQLLSDEAGRGENDE